jgi:hypothetical protein
VKPDLFRGAQQDTLRYSGFVRRSRAAAVIAYWTFHTCRTVVYFGRQGEQHIETFPGRS